MFSVSRIYVLLGLLLSAYSAYALITNFVVAPYNTREPFDGVFDRSGDVSENKYIVFVHGIGSHCLGYAQEMMDGIASADGYTLLSDNEVLHVKPYDEEECEALGSYAGSLVDSDQDRDRTVKGKRLCTEIWSQAKFYRDRGDDNGLNCKRIQYGGETLGFLRKVEYRKTASSGASTRLIAYEVVWDPSTSFVKSKYLNHLHSLTAGDMRPVNRELKHSLLHNGLADAVLYISEYKHFMQYPLVISFCEVLMGMGDLSSPNEEVVNCGYEKAYEASYSTLSPADGELVIITHSLGSRMVYDTLVNLQDNDYLQSVCRDYYVTLSEEANRICTAEENLSKKLVHLFNARLNKIFMMANQIPLLSIPLHAMDELRLQYWQKAVRDCGLLKDSDERLRCRENLGEQQDYAIGSQLKKFVDARNISPVGDPANNLQLVSFTESNDLLNYNLSCWIKSGTPFRLTDAYSSRKRKEYNHALSSILDGGRDICRTVVDDAGIDESEPVQVCRDIISYLKDLRDGNDGVDLFGEWITLQNVFLYGYRDRFPELKEKMIALRDHSVFEGANYWDWISLVGSYDKLLVLFNGLEDLARQENPALDSVLTVKCVDSGKGDVLDEVLAEWEANMNMNLVNVIVRMGADFPFLLRDPKRAHSGYWNSGVIHELIAKGSQKTQ